MECIQLKHVSKKYIGQDEKIFFALKDISFTWKEGENISIIGESGCGKSTLARLIIGLEKTSEGQIIVMGEDVSKFKYNDWRARRQNIQAVFQDTSGTLNPQRSTYKNIEETLCNLTKLSSAERKKCILELMEITDMDAKLLDTPVRKLSGGEQRRLSLLRALSIHPKFLVLDEVTAGLDVLSADSVMDVLEKYHKENGCTYLLITHDMKYAYRLTEHIIEMKKGHFVKQAFLKSSRILNYV